MTDILRDARIFHLRFLRLVECEGPFEALRSPDLHCLRSKAPRFEGFWLRAFKASPR